MGEQTHAATQNSNYISDFYSMNNGTLLNQASAEMIQIKTKHFNEKQSLFSMWIWFLHHVRQRCYDWSKVTIVVYFLAHPKNNLSDSCDNLILSYFGEFSHTDGVWGAALGMQWLHEVDLLALKAQRDWLVGKVGHDLIKVECTSDERLRIKASCTADMPDFCFRVWTGSQCGEWHSGWEWI